MRQAELWKPLEKSRCQCELCSQYCNIENGRNGKCGVRRNINGVLYTLSYDRIAALHMDPVEKKPLYHFQPGSMTLSLGTEGCNFFCSFCQNSTLSQAPKKGTPPKGNAISPQALVDIALKKKLSPYPIPILNQAFFLNSYWKQRPWLMQMA